MLLTNAVIGTIISSNQTHTLSLLSYTTFTYWN